MCGLRAGAPIDVAPAAPPIAPAAQPIAPAMAQPAMGARRTPVYLERVPDAAAAEHAGGATEHPGGAAEHPGAAAEYPGAAAEYPGGVAVRRKPARIALGSLAVGLAAVVAIWIAAGDPGDELLVGGSMGAAALALAGAGLVLTGAFHRAAAQVRCRRCARPVLAWKGAFGLHCPLAPHYARVNWLLVALTAAFWLGLLVTAIGMLVWLAF